MFTKIRKYKKINDRMKDIEISTFEYLTFCFLDEDNELILKPDDLGDFCSWIVKNHIETYLKIKGLIYQYRENRANLYSSVNSLLNMNKQNGKTLTVLTFSELQMRMNNSIDLANSTLNTAQMFVKMCEKYMEKK